ncbi:hypothetical protein BH23BAC1_BH23BAC1_18970 [soil metagenome]
MNKIPLQFILILPVWLLFIGKIYSQLEVRPILKTDPAKFYPQNLRTLRTEEDHEPLVLPFWDDFSPYEGQPDTLLWINSENVLINNSMGINPPSLGVATFDGISATGRPYTTDETAHGPADSLISRPINLELVPVDKRNTVFLSFFWQIKGKGEMPDENEDDHLLLQFKNVNGQWTDIWRPTDYNLLEVDTFYQELIMIADPAYFHNHFQFRFQSFGRLSGAFDTWNLDYIYLNQNRHVNDRTYLDRAFTKPPTSVFSQFTGIPKDHFFNDPQKYLTNSTAEIYNLDRLFQPVNYTALILNLENDQDTLDIMNFQEPFFIPTGQSRHILQANPLDFSKLNPDLESIYLHTKFYFNRSGDRNLIDLTRTTPGDTVYYDHVDFRVNDSTSTVFALDDYYSYDDGQAEFNAGISQAFGKVAYQYIVGEEDILTGMQIHFPDASPAPAGRTIELIVWKELDNNREVIYKRQNIVIENTAPNEFFTYPISPVIVSDTIYIGWSQPDGTFLGVGLDKNTDSGDKIFFNTEGAWVQNTSVEGSLMLRPVFGEGEIITSLENEPVPEKIEKAVIYPNPSEGKFFVKGLFNHIKVFDLKGLELPVNVSLAPNGNGVLDMNGFAPAIYIVHIYRGDQVQHEKIIIK